MNQIDPAAPKTTVSMVVPTFKPRLVKVEISSAGEDTFSVGGAARKATRFVLHVNIGGISGVVAPIGGKQPPDTSVWMIAGKAPGFLKAEGPLFEGGQVWRIRDSKSGVAEGRTSAEALMGGASRTQHSAAGTLISALSRSRGILPETHVFASRYVIAPWCSEANRGTSKLSEVVALKY